MKRASLFIGKHVELMRPVNQVDENLMRRIAEAKQRLIDRNIEPVALLRGKPLPAHKTRSIARRPAAVGFAVPAPARSSASGSQ